MHSQLKLWRVIMSNNFANLRKASLVYSRSQSLDNVKTLFNEIHILFMHNQNFVMCVKAS